VGLVLVSEAKLTALKLLPGVVSDDTDLAAKGRYSSADKVRFRGGKPETISGWEQFNASGIASGTARGIHAWTNLEGEPVVAVATESAVYAYINGTRTTITPVWAEVWIGGSEVDGVQSLEFDGTTVTGAWTIFTPSTGGVASPSPHYLEVGDVLTLSNLRDGSTDIVLTLTAVTDTTWTGTKTSGTAAGSIYTDEYMVQVAFRTGVVTGTADSASERATIYSLDNFGEDLVFCRSDGSPIWRYQPELSYDELVTDGDFGAGAADTWAYGTGWALTAGEAVKTAGVSSNLSQAISGVLEGGRIYEMVFTTSSFTAGTLNTFIDSIKIFPQIDADNDADPTRTWTFRFTCPASPTNLIFTASSTCNVNIDNVSITLVDVATPIQTAPLQNYACFVDANRILVALGTVEVDGDFSAMTLRWSDQENAADWVPDTDNLAGDFPLGKGNYLVGGKVVGERNLIWTDDGVYTMVFNGSPGSVYSIVPLADGCGLLGAHSVGVYSGKAFWMSRNGFHASDGAQVLAIDCPVRDLVFSKLAQYQENKTFGWMNIPYGEVWFHYADSDDDNTEISHYVSYAFLEKDNPWSCGTLDRTCMVRAGTFNNPIGVSVDGSIWYHEKGMEFLGADILPFVETAYLTGEDGDQWTGCRRYVPDFDRQVNPIQFTVTFKRRPQGQYNTTVLGPFIIREGQEKVDFMGRGRQMKLRWQSDNYITRWRHGVVGLEMLFQQERK
jgi:hypothetical protein